MDLKTIWQSSDNTPSKPAPAAGPGTAFLMEKRRELLDDEGSGAQSAELSSLLRTELGSLIKDEKMSLGSSEKAIPTRVFHLIGNSKIMEYRQSVQVLSKKRPDLQLDVSGPWPPYSFANIDLELSQSSE
jgi:hypothetical protein